MAIKYAFFDLDGTIIDSSLGILNSLNYAMQKMNLPAFSPADTWQFIGPPLTTVFAKHRDLSPADAQKAIALYREYYSQRGIFECTVYRGIPELLDLLHKNGISCVLTTCKPHLYAKRILEHHGLLQRFVGVFGPEMDGTRNEKSEVIQYAIQKLNIPSSDDVIMIGDRANDILGAAACAIDCIGVLWGFGSEKELANAGAKVLCKTPKDVSALLC